MKKIALVTFKDSAVTYQAFSELKSFSRVGGLEVKQVAVIRKNEDGKSFSIKDGLDYQSNERFFAGGIIGAIIGILGGPLGVLCGWIIGDCAGLSVNYIENKNNASIFDSIAKELDKDQTGLLIYMDETDTSILNTVITEKLGGEIERFDYNNVKEDIKTAQNHLAS